MATLLAVQEHLISDPYTRGLVAGAAYMFCGLLALVGLVVEFRSRYEIRRKDKG